ncbi:MAG: DUF3253 domain-containing protein [Pseudomonadota bacterium]
MSDEADNPVRDAILSLTETRGIGKTICPTEAARAVSEDKWRKLLPDVRVEAVRLAKAGDIAIYRKGKPVDPDAFKGVYRLGLPGKGED